jgi:CHRD domain
MCLTISRRTLLVLTASAWAESTVAASAAPTSIEVPLSGAQQVPPLQIPGSGTGKLTYDPSTRVVTWSIAYSGLSSPVTMAHFHGPAPEGKNAPVVIWLTKRNALGPNPITGQATLTPAQAEQFMNSLWYINLHTQDNPAGEIRGQVVWPKS